MVARSRSVRYIVQSKVLCCRIEISFYTYSDGRAGQRIPWIMYSTYENGLLSFSFSGVLCRQPVVVELAVSVVEVCIDEVQFVVYNFGNPFAVSMKDLQTRG